MLSLLLLIQVLLTDIGVIQAAPEVRVSLAHLILVLRRHLLRVVLHARTHSVRLHRRALPALHAWPSAIVDVDDDVVVDGGAFYV